MISSPWDEKEDLDGLIVPAPRHESLRHVGHEVWIRGSGSIPKFHGSAQKERKKNMISSPWDEKEVLDGLVVPAQRHESLCHVGHEVWIRGSGSTPNFMDPHKRKGGKNMISSPWDEKEDLDGLVVPAPRHESLRHVGHEVWIRGSGSGSTPKFHGSEQKEGKKQDNLTVE